MFHPNGPSLYELAVQALSSTERGYDLLAPKFEYTPFRTPDEVLRVAAAAVAERGAALRVVDLCCGTGAAIRHLRACANVASVTGVDRSAGMLHEARALIDPPTAPAGPGADAGAGSRRAPFALIRGDVQSLPFARRFDVVTCFGAFGHILARDEPRFIRELASAMAPGGRFVFVTADGPSPLRPAWWIARGFNAVMRVRNALMKPEFVMYYLTFLLPRARALLEAEGFTLEIRRGVFSRPYHRLVLVIATSAGGARA